MPRSNWRVTRPLSLPSSSKRPTTPMVVQRRQPISSSLPTRQQQSRRYAMLASQPRPSSLSSSCLCKRQPTSLKPTTTTTRRTKANLASDMAAKASSGYISQRSANSNPYSWMESLDTFLRKARTLPIPRWISPRHYTITAAEVLGHSSFLLVAISYAVDDFLMLRCIAVAGSTAMLFFTYYQ